MTITSNDLEIITTMLKTCTEQLKENSTSNYVDGADSIYSIAQIENFLEDLADKDDKAVKFRELYFKLNHFFNDFIENAPRKVFKWTNSQEVLYKFMQDNFETQDTDYNDNPEALEFFNRYGRNACDVLDYQRARLYGGKTK